MPPLKKYKPVNSKSHAANSLMPQPKQYGHIDQNGRPAAMRNGATVSTQGQSQARMPENTYASNQEESFSSRRANPQMVPLTGLQSPPVSSTYANGNAHYTNGNSYVPQLPPQSFQSPYASHKPHQNHHQPQNVGWSARYTPPQQSHHQSCNTSQNPFTNSFDRQRPSSSQSTQHISSPVKNGIPSLSPQNAAALRTPSYPPPQSNGISHLSPLPPTGPPAYSPVKQPSPPHAPPMHQQPSSSPVAPQPPLQASGPPSPGFSPTKQSPPRPLPLGYGIAGTPASLLPAPRLSPSPLHRGPDPLMTSLTPSQVNTTTNGQMSPSYTNQLNMT